jgi:hypothetical protein
LVSGSLNDFKAHSDKFFVLPLIEPSFLSGLVGMTSASIARRARERPRSDTVAKVGGALHVRNYRIQRVRRLNQSCATGQFLESKLLHGASKGRHLIIE